jgi:two-component system response regulator MtrA
MMVGMKGRVLVVDDDTALSEMLGIVLRGEGFEPSFCADGDKALAAFRETKPDLVLLDLMLPGRDGIDVCRQIRAESGVPIVMLTAKSDTVDVVVGLESGADDYVIKPFKPKELVARVRARLRRAEEPTPEQLAIGDLVIDVAGHSVKREGQPIALTPLEFDLLVPWLVSRGRCSPGRCCWSRSGVIGTLPIRGWSMSTCSGCGRRWSRTPSVRRSS